MTEEFGDPITAPFWSAASRRELLIQHCRKCGEYQFYPRPFCVACRSDDVEWIECQGTGTIYSKTVVHLEISQYLKPPYTVAIVELEEGPRLMTNIVGSQECQIGDRVRVTWADRPDAPPLPVFELV